MKKIVVISLFDGLSGARVALDRVDGLEVLRYYSSEIDKYAIKISNKNYPQDENYRLGSVIDINAKELLNEIKQDFGDVDIFLVAGSPCQGFSMSGKMKGSSTIDGIKVTTIEQYLDLRNKGFEFDGQSYLFWEWIRIREEINPKYYLLENVRISKEWLPMFNYAVGVTPVFINSELLSAQSRPRYYWTNLDIKIPKNKGIVLDDILIDLPIEKELSNFMTDDFYGVSRLEKGMFNFTGDKKSKCITVGSGHGNKYLIKLGEYERHRTETPNKLSRVGTTIDNGNYESSIRVYSKIGKSPTVMTTCGGGQEIKVDITKSLYRKLTPLECERLQTLPDNYTNCVSNGRRFHAIGNGFTVDVISHICKSIVADKKKPMQKTLF